VTFKVPDGHYLVSYDYGMGGVWWFIRADSPAEIRNASSELTVYGEVPEWMLEDHWNLIQMDDLKSPQSEALRMILREQD
jgi:hypothetical protein